MQARLGFPTSKEVLHWSLQTHLYHLHNSVGKFKESHSRGGSERICTPLQASHDTPISAILINRQPHQVKQSLKQLKERMHRSNTSQDPGKLGTFDVCKPLRQGIVHNSVHTQQTASTAQPLQAQLGAI